MRDRGVSVFRAAAVAGVEVVQRDAELVATRQIIEEGVVGLGRAGNVGVREVDEVGAVRDDVRACGVGVRGAGGLEEGGVFGVERGVGPFPLGFEEEGEGVAAGRG